MTLQMLLGVELPIIQAPMAGVQGSALAVAVSNAGGLGSLPGAVHAPGGQLILSTPRLDSLLVVASLLEDPETVLRQRRAEALEQLRALENGMEILDASLKDGARVLLTSPSPAGSIVFDLDARGVEARLLRQRRPAGLVVLRVAAEAAAATAATTAATGALTGVDRRIALGRRPGALSHLAFSVAGLGQLHPHAAKGGAAAQSGERQLVVGRLGLLLELRRPLRLRFREPVGKEPDDK